LNGGPDGVGHTDRVEITERIVIERGNDHERR
jgi:hypothetical protein